jgi:putative transposase
LLDWRKVPELAEEFAKLRQVDVLVSQGQNMVDAIRQIGVSEVTYYRWRQEFGGLKSAPMSKLVYFTDITRRAVTTAKKLASLALPREVVQ